MKVKGTQMNWTSLWKWGTLILGLVMICIASEYLWVTVYYGVPVWKDADTTLFCASDAKAHNTETHNVWATHACVPTDPNPQEIYLENVTENFNMWKNNMVEQMQEDVISLWDRSLKPCVKLTPLCVTLMCHATFQTTSTPSTRRNNRSTKMVFINGAIINDNKNRSSEMTDKLDNVHVVVNILDINLIGYDSTFYRFTSGYSAKIKAWSWESFDPVPILYCTPVGFAILYCNDTNFNGRGSCGNVSSVLRTYGIKPEVSLHLLLNGSLAEKDIIISVKDIINNAKIIILHLNKSVEINCTRPSNNTRTSIPIGPGQVFYPTGEIIGDIRKAYCEINGTKWNKTLTQVAEKLKEHFNKTTITFQPPPRGGGDLKMPLYHCRGELFCYCNPLQLFNNKTHTNGTNGAIVLLRIIKIMKMMNLGGGAAQAPPAPRSSICVISVSRITLILVGGDDDNNNNNRQSFGRAGGWMRYDYGYEVLQYELVRIVPPPTTTTMVEMRKREKGKRAVVIRVLIIGGIGTAAAPLSLTAMAQQILSWILRQRRLLLMSIKLMEHQQQLTCWAIKHIGSRILAWKRYLHDQQWLDLEGCSGNIICTSDVPWNSTRSNKSVELIWDNMTWTQWERELSNYTEQIYELITQSQSQQDRNEKDLLELDKWASLWSWFSITNWLWYIKIFIMIVGGLIGLRIIFAVLYIVNRVRQGYSRCPSQIHRPSKQPDRREGIEDEGSEHDRDRSMRLVNVSLAISWDDLRCLCLFCYHRLRDSIMIAEMTVESMGHSSLKGLRRGWEGVKYLGNRMLYWIQELKTSAISLSDASAIAVAGWTDRVIELAQTAWRTILHIRRRIRQGLERHVL
ncbi:envelope glycoprotein [Human immunodeficiency virus 1]|uniref:Envelope glycoprotein gp160 n=1 Tax=Human immunodeficiency virus type 1 TaxID=11676 RepID=A0A0C5K9M2_HV1|nr:envelope glycoprotein [Human immunodeficiency virus 1]